MDVEAAKNLADEGGNISKESFMALGTKTKLVDLAGKAEADTPEHTPQHHPHHHQHHHHQKRVRHTQNAIYLLQLSTSTNLVDTAGSGQLESSRLVL